MIHVVSSRDIYGIWGSYILNNLVDNEFSFQFVKSLEPGNIEFSEEHMGLILLGMPLKLNQIASVEEHIEDLTNTPFTVGQHYANWGVELNHLQSYVDNEKNFVLSLDQMLTGDEEFLAYKGKDEAYFGKQLAEALQSHHKYDGGKMGKDLMLLAEHYGPQLIHKEFRNFNELYEQEKETITLLKNHMKEYVNNKVEQANIQTLTDGTIVVSLRAERHVNEIGKVFIDSLSKGYSKVIVMIGQETRGDDLYRIRTSEGVSANDVALDLNLGQGKERAATVFLPSANQAVYNTIVSTLNGSLFKNNH